MRKLGLILLLCLLLILCTSCTKAPEVVSGGVDDRRPILPLDEHDVHHVDEGHAVPVVKHHAAAGLGRRFRRRGVGQGSLIPLGIEAVPGTLQRFDDALGLEGLHQVVKGIHLKGVAHVLVVGGGEDEDDAGIHVLDDTGRLHAGFAGHFYIQEHNLRAELLHQLDCLYAVLCLAHQVETLHLGDHLALNHAHSFVIISDEYANLIHLVCSLLVLTYIIRCGLGRYFIFRCIFLLFFPSRRRTTTSAAGSPSEYR